VRAMRMHAADEGKTIVAPMSEHFLILSCGGVLSGSVGHMQVAHMMFGDAVFNSDGVRTVKESMQNVMDAARHGSHPPHYPSGQYTMQLDPLYATLLRILGTAFLASSVASYALRVRSPVASRLSLSI
jgi:hypothetical protein